MRQGDADHRTPAPGGDGRRIQKLQHAAMLLEWLRRNVPQFDHELGEYLHREGPIATPDD